jgi:hypothetical protein
MIEIKDLLLNFNQLILSKEIQKESIRSVISSVVNIPLTKEQIKIKNNIIYLDIKPIYKNEILLKRDRIFDSLKEELGKKTPKDIR